MSMSRDELLIRVNREAPPASRKRIQALFQAVGAPSFKVRPVHSKVDEALRLWVTRLKTSQLPPGSLRGIRSLVDRLRSLPSEAEIEQFGFTGKILAGSVIFDRASGEFLGDTILERRAKSQQMLDIEAQLLGPSRKSA